MEIKFGILMSRNAKQIPWFSKVLWINSPNSMIHNPWTMCTFKFHTIMWCSRSYRNPAVIQCDSHKEYCVWRETIISMVCVWIMQIWRCSYFNMITVTHVAQHKPSTQLPALKRWQKWSFHCGYTRSWLYFLLRGSSAIHSSKQVCYAPVTLQLATDCNHFGSNNPQSPMTSFQPKQWSSWLK